MIVFANQEGTAFSDPLTSSGALRAAALSEHGLNRKDLNYPPTAVGGISE